MDTADHCMLTSSKQREITTLHAGCAFANAAHDVVILDNYRDTYSTCSICPPEPLIPLNFQSVKLHYSYLKKRERKRNACSLFHVKEIKDLEKRRRNCSMVRAGGSLGAVCQ